MELTPRSRITSQNCVNRPPTAVRWGEQLQMIDVSEDVFPSSVEGCERLLGAESRPQARRRPPVPGSFSGGGGIPRAGSFITSRSPVLRIPSTLLHVTF